MQSLITTLLLSAIFPIPLLATTVSQTAGTATTTTLNIFLIADPQSLHASIVSANPQTTSIHVSCPLDGDPTECGFGPGAMVEHISGSIWQGSMGVPDGGFTMTWSCEFAMATGTNGDDDDTPTPTAERALCVASAGGEEANFPRVETVALTGTEVTFMEVTVTAGAEKLDMEGEDTGSSTESGDVTSSTAMSVSGSRTTSVSNVSATATSSVAVITSGNGAGAPLHAISWTSGGVGVVVAMVSWTWFQFVWT